jgi:sugar/nucleoside kinase (ribokinase family)
MNHPEIICLGEALIDFTPPRLGTSITVTGELRLTAGGAPANVAVGLARLECPSGFLGKVGADFFGQHLQQVLAGNGVDTSHMLFDRNANTGLAFVNWNERAEAEYLFYRNPSADTRLAPEDIAPDYLQTARVLQLGSLLLATEPSASATYAALQIAASAGLIISYDVNLRLTFWKDATNALEGIKKPFEYVSIVKLNQAELAFLTGDSDPESGTAKLWQANFRLIVVTLDKKGCYYRTADFSGYIPAFPAQVVDTVGAGDGFMAGLLARLWQDGFALHDQPAIERACRNAAAVGALTVQKPGAIPALPYRKELDTFLESFPA